MSPVAWDQRDVALVDLIDRLLAGGVVIAGDITLAVADVDLVHVSLARARELGHRRGAGGAAAVAVIDLLAIADAHGPPEPSVGALSLDGVSVLYIEATAEEATPEALWRREALLERLMERPGAAPGALRRARGRRGGGGLRRRRARGGAPPAARPCPRRGRGGAADPAARRRRPGARRGGRRRPRRARRRRARSDRAAGARAAARRLPRRPRRGRRRSSRTWPGSRTRTRDLLLLCTGPWPPYSFAEECVSATRSCSARTPLDPFAREERRLGQALSRRIDADPDKLERGLAQLVLTIVELLRQLMERQALRRIDGGGLDRGPGRGARPHVHGARPADGGAARAVRPRPPRTSTSTWGRSAGCCSPRCHLELTPSGAAEYRITGGPDDEAVICAVPGV